MAGESRGGARVLDPAGLAPPGGHYSHVSVANGFVFVSGQLPIAPDGTRLSDAPFEQQARQVLANMQLALAAAGSGIDRLVQVRVYVDSIEHWPAFNAIYAEWAGAARPARAVVPTGPLHFGLKVEMEAVAMIGTAREIGEPAEGPSQEHAGADSVGHQAKPGFDRNAIKPATKRSTKP